MKNKENIPRNTKKIANSMKDLNVKLAQLEINRKILIPKRTIKGLPKKKSQVIKQRESSPAIPSLQTSNNNPLQLIEDSLLIDLF